MVSSRRPKVIRELSYRSGNYGTTVSVLRYLSRLTSQAEFQQEADRIAVMIGDNSARGNCQGSMWDMPGISSPLSQLERCWHS